MSKRRRRDERNGDHLDRLGAFSSPALVQPRLSGLPGVAGLALAAVVSVAAVWFPWFGHPLPFWSASLSANFSVIMVLLLVVSVFDRAFETGIFRPRDWRAAWIFGGVASVLLYHSALGLGPQNFDAYALGWPWLFWGQ